MKYGRILILGGYGNSGLAIAQRLLAESGVQLVIAGRRQNRAKDAAGILNASFDCPRVSAACVDAADPCSLRRSFGDVDMVIVASSTSVWAGNVADAALEAGIDYLDVQYSRAKTAMLQEMASAISVAGCCFITDGGFHPGLPAALVRYVAPYFDALENANVGSVIKIDWTGLNLSPETMTEFVEAYLDFSTLVYRAGRWQELGMLGMMKPVTMDFGREFGRQYCVPMFLEEMRSLPGLFPTLQETGFFVGGFNWFTDWLVSPLIMLGLKLAPIRGVMPMSRLFRWSLNTFSRPPYGTMLKVEARGTRHGQPHTSAVTLYHQDGYAFTAIPVVATVLQLLDGSIGTPGLHLQAHIVDPTRLLRDMARLGVEVALAA